MTLTVASPLDPLGSSVRAGIFLAGPAQGDGQRSWRAEAIDALARRGFAGEVYDPAGALEAPPGSDERSWADAALEVADVVAWWFPRGSAPIDGPTAVELGRCVAEGRALLGTDAEAPAAEELVAVAARAGLEVHRSIDGLVDAALDALGPPAVRHGPDRFVPLPVWRSPSFQRWRRAIADGGHRIEDLRILWRWPTGPGTAPFAWVAHPRVDVAGEDRAKANEIVVGRPDTASLCAWALDETGRLEVVLVREFRSPTGHVLGLPGGSIDDHPDPRLAATTELAEEVGLTVAPDRLVAHGTRRSSATLSSHSDHLFSVELTAGELNALRRDVGTYGVGEHERTTVAVVPFADLDGLANVDWPTLGAVRHVLDPPGPPPQASSSLPIDADGPEGP